MQTVSFAGSTYTGCVELRPADITLLVVPSDPEAYPYLSAVILDPTPEQADAIAVAISEWAALRRARQFSNGQLELLGMLS